MHECCLFFKDIYSSRLVKIIFFFKQSRIENLNFLFVDISPLVWAYSYLWQKYNNILYLFYSYGQLLYDYARAMR